MNRFLSLVAAVLGSSLLAYGEGAPSIRIEQFKGKATIKIERIPALIPSSEPSGTANEEDPAPDASGCSFYLAPPYGEGGEADTIFFVPSRSNAVISVFINGVLEKLHWSPAQVQNKSHADYTGAWSNGKITIEVHCALLANSDKYYKGTIEVRVGKTRRRFKIAGFCGC